MFFAIVANIVSGASPTAQPSNQPSNQPTRHPTRQPSQQPSQQPSNQPTGCGGGLSSTITFYHEILLRPPSPSSCRHSSPSHIDSLSPPFFHSSDSSELSYCCLSFPFHLLSTHHFLHWQTAQPSRHPTRQPSQQPSARPSKQPNSHPTSQPSQQPVMRPSCQPSGSNNSPFVSFPTQTLLIFIHHYSYSITLQNNQVTNQQVNPQDQYDRLHNHQHIPRILVVNLPKGPRDRHPSPHPPPLIPRHSPRDTQHDSQYHSLPPDQLLTHP